MRSHYDIEAIRRTYLDTPEEAVFLERAKILQETRERYANLPPGMRQGKVIVDLCEGITPVVRPDDIFLGRVHEEIPTPGDEAFIESHRELFISPGVPGWLDSAGIYIPDWEKLLRLGISGLIAEVEGLQATHDADGDSGTWGDNLEGVRLSLQGISRLIERYAATAREQSAGTEDRQPPTQLLEAAACCERVATLPPETFREALQLFVLFHMSLACLIGGRNVTPGRMDQYLFPFYERDAADRRITSPEAVGLLAAMMVGLSQLTGSIATDFQSKKRTPNRYSHCYITIAGLEPDGRSAVNELSFLFLEAIRLVNHREPSLSVRYFTGIDRTFWHKAVDLMRARLPVFAYNDGCVIPALVRHGVRERIARDYAHCGCLNCFVPGHDLQCMRSNHNLPQYLLLAINGGRDPLTGEQKGPATPPTESLCTFGDVFDALRNQVRAGLARTVGSYASRSRDLPLPVWPLFDGYPEAQCAYREHKTRYADQHMVGVATAVDSLLAIQQAVYRDKKLTLEALVSALQKDFSGCEPLRLYLLDRTPSYGSDDPEVTEMIGRLGDLYVEEVQRASAALDGIVLRPGFHTWLYNLSLGKQTMATPDGRLCGDPLSSDHLPSPGKGRAPTEVLRCIAHLPHDHTCSGGTTFQLSPSHFGGTAGIRSLASLIEAYFEEGGLQLHFLFTDSDTLRDAVESPEQYRDLLVRVTGFSEYFVRLLPEVQQEIIRRTASQGSY